MARKRVKVAYEDEREEDISANNKDRDRFYARMSSEQHALFDSIQNNSFTFCKARAGTGKTTVAVAAMLDLLMTGKITKIIYIQKCSPRFLEHGFLPGTAEEKTANLYIALYDAMETLGVNQWKVKEMVDREQLLLKTDSDLRGCNFENAGVCMDETENMDFHTLKLILTRIHDNCHVCMLGDEKQKDGSGDNSVFIDYGEYMAKNVPGECVSLTHNFRGRLSKIAEDFERRSKSRPEAVTKRQCTRIEATSFNHDDNIFVDNMRLAGANHDFA